MALKFQLYGLSLVGHLANQKYLLLAKPGFLAFDRRCPVAIDNQNAGARRFPLPQSSDSPLDCAAGEDGRQAQSDGIKT